VRTIIAVISGFLGIGVLVRFTDLLFARLVHGWNPKDPPLYYFAVSLVTDFVYSMIGGYICALIAGNTAKRRPPGLSCWAKFSVSSSRQFCGA
jgi:hypothetical protein